MRKSVKKNNNTYKNEIKGKLEKLRINGLDPEGIRVTASNQFTDKLIIDHSPDHKKTKRS